MVFLANSSPILKNSSPRVYTDVCCILCIVNIYTAAYHLQTDGGSAHFKRTLLTRFYHYVSDYPCPLNELTDAFIYAYSTRSHNSASYSPFALMMASPLLTLALEARPSIMSKNNPIQWYPQWKHWLETLINTINKRLRDTHAQYRRHFYARHSHADDEVSLGDLLFDKAPFVDHLHKLASVASEPCLVVAADTHTVPFQRPDKSVESTSRQRIVKTLFPHKNEDQATWSFLRECSAVLLPHARGRFNVFFLDGSFFKKGGIGCKSASLDSTTSLHDVEYYGEVSRAKI